MLWKKQKKQDPPTKLWEFISQIRNGRTSEDDAEIKELLTVASMVGTALSADTETGPEDESRAQLTAVIQKDLQERQLRAAVSGTRWWSAAAVAGWTAALVCIALLSYNTGIRVGLARTEAQIRQTQQMLAKAVQNVHRMSQQLSQMQMIAAGPNRHGFRNPDLATAATRDGSVSTRIPGGETTKPPYEAANTSQNPQDPAQIQEQARLMREGYDRVLRGDWEGAVQSFQKAAELAPEQESALDALHAAAQICRGPLNDPRRAAEFSQKELKLARLLLRQNAGQGDVQIRVARAFETAGLMDGNPDLLAEAVRLDAKGGTESSP
ncbi:MAG: tetratricopeptide repeat protein [Armatimonadota bacterium]